MLMLTIQFGAICQPFKNFHRKTTTTTERQRRRWPRRRKTHVHAFHAKNSDSKLFSLHNVCSCTRFALWFFFGCFYFEVNENTNIFFLERCNRSSSLRSRQFSAMKNNRKCRRLAHSEFRERRHTSRTYQIEWAL